MQYVIKEVATETMVKGQKVFETPNGQQFRVSITPNGTDSIMLQVTKRDTGEYVSSFTVPITEGNANNIKVHIENQLAASLREAEARLKARDEAKGFILNTWGVDISNPNDTPEVVSTENSTVQYLDDENSTQETNGENQE